MKRWYVVQVYAGGEEIAKTDILKRVREEGLEEFFGDILIPAAKLRQLFEVADHKDRQLLPGYVLVEVELTPETKRLVTMSTRVLRFLGGKEPVPLSLKEITKILSQMKGEIVVTSEKSDFFVGAEVDIIDGPFAGFVGVVEKLDKVNDRLTVMVGIFGRMTPVELGFHQVK